MNGSEVKPGLRQLPLGIGALTVVLCLLFLLMRSAAMFGPAPLAPLLPLMCIGMIALPWVVLSPHGRFQIGIKLPVSFASLLPGLFGGVAAACVCFYLGSLLYGSSAHHWFVSIARSYQAQPLPATSLLQLYLSVTLASILFSPLGEEIFFRGFLQRVLEQRVSRVLATHLQAALFALVHLCHHGLVASASGLTLLPASAACWLLLMFGFSWLCAWLRRRADSLLPPIFAHAAFNATMNAFIFAYLWQR